MPLAEPNTEIDTRMAVVEPAHGPRAALIASIATTDDDLITATNPFVQTSPSYHNLYTQKGCYH